MGYIHFMTIISKTADRFPLSLVFAEAGLYLANDMYLPAMPTISKELHTTADMVQLTLTLFLVGIAALYPFAGPLSDRFGKRTMVLAGVLIFIITSIGCVFSFNINHLIFWRLIQGSSIAFVVVGGYAAIHERYDQMQAIMILSWMGSITILAPALGPLIGSGILTFLHWRLIFALQILWGLIAFFAIYYYMPREKEEPHEHALHLGTILKKYRNILLTPGFTLNILAFTGLFSGFIAWMAAGAFIVIRDYQYSPIQYGLIQCVIFLAFIAGTMVVRQLIQRFPINYVIDLGLGLAGFGAVLSCMTALIWPANLLLTIAVFMIFSFGCAIAFSCLSRTAIEASDETMAARMAMMTTLMSVGNVISTFAISLLHDSLANFAGILLVCTLLGIGSRVILIKFKRES